MRQTVFDEYLEVTLLRGMSVLQSFRLDGQVAIVTGASRGLGAAMATGLAEAGADVALVARGDLGETRASIERLGRRAIAINADLGDRAAPEAILNAAKNADILVNNAGIIRRASFVDYRDEDWDSVIEVNLRAAFALSRAFARALVRGRAEERSSTSPRCCRFRAGFASPPTPPRKADYSA